MLVAWIHSEKIIKPRVESCWLLMVYAHHERVHDVMHCQSDQSNYICVIFKDLMVIPDTHAHKT